MCVVVRALPGGKQTISGVIRLQMSMVAARCLTETDDVMVSY